MAKATQPRALYLVLLRMSPSTTPHQTDELLQSVRQELAASTGDAAVEVVYLRAYGACTHLVLARTSAVHRISCVPPSGPLKKSQIIYGLELPDYPVALFEQSAEDSPLVLITFTKLHERLALLGQRESIPYAIAAAVGRGGVSVARSLAWADLICLAAGRNLNELDCLLPDGLCNLTCPATLAEVLPPYEQGHPLAVLGKAAEYWPLFSRCFTVFARRHELGPDAAGHVDYSRLQGAVPAAYAEFWVKAGGAGLVARALRDNGWHGYTNKGYPDLVALLQPEAPLPVADLLEAYETRLLPQAVPGLLSAKLSLFSETAATVAGDPDFDLPFEQIQQRVPEQFMRVVSAAGPDSGDDTVLVLERMYWVCNRLLRNRVQFPFVADIALHLNGLTRYLDGLAPSLEARRELIREACGTVRTDATIIASALAQRSHGDYYDLFSDAPNVIFEYPAGIQRLFIAWWFLASRIVDNSAPEPTSIYVVVGQGEAPLALTISAGAVLAFPPSLVYGSSGMLWSLCHEIGEVVFASDFFDDAEPGEAGHETRPMPGDLELIINHRDLRLQSHPYWRLPEWRQALTSLMREVYCDSYAFLGPLSCDPEPAMLHLRGRILRLPPDDANLAYAAFRALIVACLADDYEPLSPPSAGHPHPYVASSPLAFIPDPTEGEVSEREVELRLETARHTIGTNLDNTEWLPWTKAWDRCLELLREVGLLNPRVLALARAMVEMAHTRALALQLCAASDDVRGDDVSVALDTLRQWARTASGDSDGRSTVTCQWLLDLSDRATRRIGQEVWPKLMRQ